MALARAQKKYLKKNLKRFSLAKIASDISVSEEEILKFLKSRWQREKYQKFLSQQKRQARKESPPLTFRVGFNLKKYLTQNWKALAFLAFLVFTVYLNSLGNNFVSDDIAAIKDNPEIGKVSYFWKPPYFNINLRSLIIFLSHKIFGLNPAFYRLSNILFHLGSVWIIYFLMAGFFSSPVPFFTAGIFAVHPILTEAVTWISGGPYSNATFFILLSFLAYIWSVTNKKIGFYLTSIFLFLLTLLFFGKIIIFPLILFLYEFCFGKLRTNWRRLIPFWAISGFWTLYLIGPLGERVTALETTYYQEPGISNPFIQIPIAITSYLQLIFWPKNLTLYHSEEFYFSQIEYFLRAGVLILFLAAIVYFFKKDRRIFFWLSFFLITLSPNLTPLRISWWVAERYASLAVLGIFVVIGFAILKIGQKFKNQELSWLIFALIILALSGRTIIRNMDWKNEDALWLATAKTSPHSPKNHNNLGDYYSRHGDYQKAIEEFKTAIELMPNYGDAYHNLANAYREIGNNEEAIASYQKALSFNPNLWQSHQNLAARYFEQGEFELTLQELEKAIKINPQNPALYTNLGIVYLQLNEKEKAKEAFQQALLIDPQNQRAKEGLLSL